MRQYRIRGGIRLCGAIEIGGAKNAVLPILSAACLNESETIIHNCPRISDAFDTVEILRSIGFGVRFVGNTLTISPCGNMKHEIPDKYAGRMRSSILFIGAMLAQTGRVNIASPGGCCIGERAIDLHIDGLKKMGAKIREEERKLFCETDGLRGARIRLKSPSVGATENLMIAATKAQGETIIENAAREPEIIDLAQFLQNMGADIRGAGSGTIIINGVKKFFRKTMHTIIPDRIVAGTYLTAAAMTGGEIQLTNIRPKDLAPFANYFSEMNCKYRTENSTAYLRAPERLLAIPRLVTGVHPGFPTDMQAQFVAALSTATGHSEVTEKIFDKRFSHAQELRHMKANIRLTADNRTFIIEGTKLRGAVVTARDLRCGASLVLAAMAAEGESIVQNAEFIERGYAQIEKDLSALGADIQIETALEKCA
ncbi:MAG: UDP-N-acetylglucosamine 1-carboxyvinyltransferase [Clostridiales bacterium]|nr:UDP-N-acetylglucosamine 1-carboxyvinyltransferase [Clostridiales bacterium]